MPGPAPIRRPSGSARGGIVLLHEIYGLNAFIDAIAEQLVGAGWAVLAPDLYGPLAPGAPFEPTETGTALALAARDRLGFDAPLDTIESARAALAGEGPVAVWGFSFGASLAWRAAARGGFAAALAFSPGNLAQFLDERPRCPVFAVFGARDPKTPEPVRSAAARAVGVETLTVPAGHAFYAPGRADHDAGSARVAMAQAMEFLDRTFRPPS
jgi:carboxymethylenebutenolidase